MNTQYALPHVFFTLMHQCISFIRVWVKIFLMCLSHNLYVDVFVRVIISHLFNVTVYSRLLTIRLYTIYIRDTVFHYKLKELFFFFFINAVALHKFFLLFKQFFLNIVTIITCPFFIDVCTYVIFYFHFFTQIHCTFFALYSKLKKLNEKKVTRIVCGIFSVN